jgi:hypothetical protein
MKDAGGGGDWLAKAGLALAVSLAVPAYVLWDRWWMAP